MTNISRVVQQLRRERERAQKEVQRIGAALAALGSISSKGSSRHTMSAAARRAESAMGNEDSQTEANDLGGRSQANGGSAESKVGEGEGRCQE
jgi:hypothetical protein